MSNDKSIFVVIPALNEEKNITPTVDMVQNAVRNHFSRCQIAIFNDGSSDHTGTVAEEIARKYDNVQVIHHDRPKGLGYVYKSGIKLSTCDYVIMVPGDNEGLQKSFEKIFSHAGHADIVIPFTANSHVRPLIRRIVSKAFVFILNVMFLLRLKYYNGCVLHRTDVINSVPIQTDSFAYQAEALIKLIKKGHSFIEVGVDIQERPTGGTKAFSLKNIINVAKTFFSLIREIYFRNRVGLP